MTNSPAVWIDGDPLMEAIAAAVWERCVRDDVDMPQLVLDDPRTIAAAAAAVARALVFHEAAKVAQDCVALFEDRDGVGAATAGAVEGLADRFRCMADEQPTTTKPDSGPPCGNNPNFRLTPGDRQAVDDFKAYLAQRADEAQPSEPPIVAYRSDGGRLLNCLQHVPPPAARPADFRPVTAEDLPDGGICIYPECGVDVLIPQDGAQP